MCGLGGWYWESPVRIKDSEDWLKGSRMRGTVLCDVVAIIDPMSHWFQNSNEEAKHGATSNQQSHVFRYLSGSSH